MNNNKGFTFIEVIVAMVILSFIVTGGYSLINSSFKIVSRETSKTDMRNDLRVALVQITKDIQESMTLEDSQAQGFSPVFSQSDSKKIAYEYDNIDKKVYRHEDDSRFALIEGVGSFDISVIEGYDNDEVFDVRLTVNDEEHGIQVVRRIKSGSIDSVNYSISISGTVRYRLMAEENCLDNALLGAVIIVRHSSGIEYYTETNNNGEYTVNVMQQGDYTVIASKLGYVSDETTIVGLSENLFVENLCLIKVSQDIIAGDCIEIQQNDLSQGNTNNLDNNSYIILQAEEGALQAELPNGKHLSLANSIVFVDRDFIIKGHIKGYGTVYVNGDLTLQPGAKIDNGVQVYVAGNVNRDGSNGRAGTVHGVIYANGKNQHVNDSKIQDEEDNYFTYQASWVKYCSGGTPDP